MPQLIPLGAVIPEGMEAELAGLILRPKLGGLYLEDRVVPVVPLEPGQIAALFIQLCDTGVFEMARSATEDDAPGEVEDLAGEDVVYVPIRGLHIRVVEAPVPDSGLVVI